MGWSAIAIILFVTYVGEVIKGKRTLSYLFAFIPAIFFPLLVVLVLYRKKPDWKFLCHLIVPGYFVMYIFVMLTGSTTMVFSYILPMLALLVLYHNPKLILFTGVASLLINIFSIAVADAYDAMTGTAFPEST